MKLTTWGIALALGLHGALAAAQAWPTKPIRLIIGFPPGGGADTVARPIADALARELGQPVIVDNKPGAGTTIAASQAAGAAPDGYTLFMSNAGTFGSLQFLYKDFKRAPTDYTPITLWANSTLLVAVSNQFGVNNVKELVARAKAEPGKFNYASSGTGGGTHLPGVLFTKLAGVDIVHVPYKGGAPALQGLVAGETQLTFGTPPSVLPLARANRLKVIAITAGKRSSLFPDVPTVAEGGVKGYDYSMWWGLFGPAHLPQPIVQRLYEASKKILADPALREKLAASGSEAAVPMPPAEFGPFAIKSGAQERELTVASGATSN